MLRLMEPAVLFRRTSVAGDIRRLHSRLTIMILYMRHDHLSLKYANRSNDISVDSSDRQPRVIASDGASLDDVIDLSKSVPDSLWPPKHSSSILPFIGQKTIDQRIPYPDMCFPLCTQVSLQLEP